MEQGKGPWNTVGTKSQRLHKTGDVRVETQECWEFEKGVCRREIVSL